MNESKKPTHILIRGLDAAVVGLIKGLIALAHLKSRDPREHASNVLRADPQQLTRIRNWQAVLEWSPEKRVGCFTGVLIGTAIGGVILWYNLK